MNEYHSILSRCNNGCESRISRQHERNMTYYFAHGIVRYKPDGWVIIEAPHGIVNYYKWWVEKFIGKKLSTSLHKPHITVVAAKHEPALYKGNWKKYDGKSVEFKYYSEIRTDHPWFFRGKYYWLRVECPFISEIRESLWLKPKLKWPYHLTIGYCGY